MNLLEEEIQAEKARGEYDKKIKKKCAWCNDDIPGTTEWYVYHGNACQECCNRFSKIDRGIRQKEKGYSKRRSRYEHRIRKYTREEIDAMMLARIKEVKLKQQKT
jgi:hypothetical protein